MIHATPKRVLVTDARRGSAIAFMRSLGRAGWEVTAADSDPRSAGFRSRFATRRLVYPSPRQSPRAFVDALHDSLRAHRIDMVVPVTDECIHPLAHARERFEGLTRLAIADDAALAAVSNKATTLELARSLGVPIPETRVVLTRSEGRQAARALGFPLVLKPSVSRLYDPRSDRIDTGAVCFARDRRELGRCLEELLPRHVVLAQRYRTGVGVGVEALARDGRVLLAFQHRRLAEIPVTGGASAWRESTALQPELLEYARRLIAALDWTGLIMVEFRVDATPVLMEINGRIWGSLPLACRAGIDFPRALAALYFPDDAPAGPTGSYPVGMRSYDLELMLSWIGQTLLGSARNSGLQHPPRHDAFAGLAGLLDPTQKSDLSGDGDFAPRLAQAGRIGRKLAGKLLRRGGRD